MDGFHDLGGRQGFGRVRYSPHAPVFHHAWERLALTLTSLATKEGWFCMDEYRHAIERMEPRHYMSASYYERVITSLATLAVEKGFISHGELERHVQGDFPLSLKAAPGRTNVAGRWSFKVGDRVKVRNDFVPGHVRFPAYIRGKQGVIVLESAPYPFPDAHGHGLSAEDEPSYEVCFRSEDIWPDASDSADIHVGLFQSYLEPADSVT